MLVTVDLDKSSLIGDRQKEGKPDWKMFRKE